jgi:hypothetical protein
MLTQAKWAHIGPFRIAHSQSPTAQRAATAQRWAFCADASDANPILYAFVVAWGPCNLWRKDAKGTTC